MLKGTPEELDYHASRATAEMALSGETGDPAAAAAHRALALLHRNRADLVTALRDASPPVNQRPVWRTDKEG